MKEIKRVPVFLKHSVVTYIKRCTYLSQKSSSEIQVGKNVQYWHRQMAI